LSFRYTQGRGDAALTKTKEAAVLYRRLASERPDAFAPGLAGHLSNLANRLAAAGQDESALATAHEAVATMAPYFIALPEAFAGTTPRILATYVQLAKRLNRKLDMALIEPVVKKLSEMQRL